MGADPWNGVGSEALDAVPASPVQGPRRVNQARRLAVCVPASDVAFGERVRHVVADRRWDLDGPDGLARITAVLRRDYPHATVTSETRAKQGGWHPLVILEILRDGPA